MRKFIILLLLCFSIQVNAVTRIDITRGNVEPTKIAYSHFTDNGGGSANLVHKIREVIEYDLASSGLFETVPSDLFLEKATVQRKPNLHSWRQIKAAILVTGEVDAKGDKVSTSFRVWDSYSELEIVSKNFIANKDNWRKIAHKLADEIYSAVTGEQGYFNTKIAYIAESGPAKKRIKKLALMDSDGNNNQILSFGNYLVLTPRISPDATKILYMSYAGKKPKVHLRDINSGQDKVIGHFPGMSFAPRFSPDGKKAVMSVTSNGNTDIYEIDLDNKVQTKLTEGTWIDTSPYYSPDGKQIIFSSDRSGKPQLYIMSNRGGEAKRISFGIGSYNTPAWSPRGDFIAFTKQYGGRFHIGVMRPDGSGERIITEGYMVEGPTWSPNGRFIIFTKDEENRGSRMSKSKLYMVDLTGNYIKEIPTPTDASDPCWSPLLQ